MVKYLIHCCPKRKWYVDEYLVPSMLEQGISEDDILIYNDEKKLGNLRAFVDSANLVIGTEGATWHLQDDVIISKSFKKLTEKYQNSVVCGFCNQYSTSPSGYRTVNMMWYSFPCIRISNKLLEEFIEWLSSSDIQNRYRFYIEKNKFDDSLFREFMIQCKPKNLVLNLLPNIVDNIDFLIGGSLINYLREEKDVGALYFRDRDLIEKLKEELEKR